MWPIILTLGPITIYSYGLMVALAAIVCSYLMAAQAKRQGFAPQLVYDFIFWVLLSGIVVARLFYVAISWEDFAYNPMEILLLNHGGLSWQGGFIGALIAGLAYLKVHHLNIWQWMDLSAPYIALGQAIGRLGCFANGCCYGKTASWGVFFPVHQLTLIPTQLMEAGALLAIYGILRLVIKKHLWPGSVFAWYLILAGAERLMIEFWRADQKVFWGSLSLFQWIALMVMVIGLMWVLRHARKTNI